MMDGRFDQHFLELFAGDRAQDQNRAGLPAFVLALALLALSVMALVAA